MRRTARIVYGAHPSNRQDVHAINASRHLGLTHVVLEWKPDRPGEVVATGGRGPMAGDAMKHSVTKGGEHVSRTITRADLAEAVYQRVGLSRTESAELVEMVLSEIADTVAGGETVKLSSFGSFVVRSKGERIGRNPKTGVEVPITPRRVMVFRPSNILKLRINGENVADEAE